MTTRPVLLAILLAGCAAPAALPAVDAPVPVTLPWSLTGCSAVIAVIPVASQAFGDRVPDGYRLLTPAEAGLPGDPRGDATLGVEAFTCAEGAGVDGTLDGIAYGSFFAFVEPPQDLVLDGAFAHFLKWETLVPDEARREVLFRAGVPALAGSVSFDVFRDGPAVVHDVGLTMEGAGSFRFAGSAAAPPPDFAPSFTFREFTPVPGGVVMWDAHVAGADLKVGTAVLTLSDGSFPAEAAGATTVQAYTFAGPVDFGPGTIQLPPR